MCKSSRGPGPEWPPAPIYNKLFLVTKSDCEFDHKCMLCYDPFNVQVEARISCEGTGLLDAVFLFGIN